MKQQIDIKDESFSCYGLAKVKIILRWVHRYRSFGSFLHPSELSELSHHGLMSRSQAIRQKIGKALCVSLSPSLDFPVLWFLLHPHYVHLYQLFLPVLNHCCVYIVLSTVTSLRVLSLIWPCFLIFHFPSFYFCFNLVFVVCLILHFVLVP